MTTSRSSFSFHQQDDDALNKYRKAQALLQHDWNNNSYSLQDDELRHSDDKNNDDSSSTTTTTFINNNNNSFSSQNSTVTTSKYHHGTNVIEKSLNKEKSPDSVDRSLRNQGWVGGHAPHGFQKPRRSYKLKNPSDAGMSMFMKK